MNADWLLSWWNLVFLIPFGLALLYLGVYAASGLTFGDTHTDLEHDVDADAHFEHEVAEAEAPDVHAEAHLEADHDASGRSFAAEGNSPSASLAAASPAGSLQAMATWFGVGRVPLSILLMVFCFTWGAIGFIGNAVFLANVGMAWQTILLSFPLALAGGTGMTRGIGRLMVRYVPLNETYAGRRHDLLGAVGEAVFEITPEFGIVSVRDERGNLFQVACRAGVGVGPIAKGSKVKLVTYNLPLRLYFVIPHDPVGSKAVA